MAEQHRKYSRFKAPGLRIKWRGQLLRKQKYLCGLCKQHIPRPSDFKSTVAYQRFRVTFDHIVPKSKGGEDVFSNLQVVHSRCNSKKGDKTSWSPENPSRDLIRVIHDLPKQRHPRIRPALKKEKRKKHNANHAGRQPSDENSQEGVL